MNRDTSAFGTGGGRVQWGSYGFLAGILLGVVVGWMFAGFVGALVRVGIVLVAIVPLVLLFMAWRKFVMPLRRPAAQPRYIDSYEAIETRAVVRGAVQDSQAL